MRPQPGHLIPPVCLLVLLGACGIRPSGELEARLEALEDSVTTLSEVLGASVDLKPGEAAFSVLRLDVGSLAITFDSVIAAESGSSLALTIGNLASAEIDQIVAMLWWGTPQADGSHEVSERQSRNLTLAQPLPPGAWTKVSVALDSVPPDAIKFLRISNASATSIKLP